MFKNKNELVLNSLKSKHNTVSLKFIILLLKTILYSVKIKIFLIVLIDFFMNENYSQIMKRSFLNYEKVFFQYEKVFDLNMKRSFLNLDKVQ